MFFGLGAKYGVSKYFTPYIQFQAFKSESSSDELSLETSLTANHYEAGFTGYIDRFSYKISRSRYDNIDLKLLGDLDDRNITVLVGPDSIHSNYVELTYNFYENLTFGLGYENTSTEVDIVETIIRYSF